MCGVAGYFGFDPEAEDRIVTMMQMQVHRGPDAHGKTVLRVGNGSLALGHRRLSIIDTSPAGNQPMQHAETGDTIVFNGEIYNFLQLRQELVRRGHRFLGGSDTEVILHAFAAWGTDCFARLHGMFALALYQPSRQRLVLARDPLGIKPLYYALTPEAFAFASELRALKLSGLLPPEIDQRALAGFLAYGAVQEPLTIISGARMFPAGNWTALDLAAPLPLALDPNPHWTFPEPDCSSDLNDARQSVQQLLKRSVRRHLISDVPVGIFLSSGLDSSAVAAFATECSPGLETFTVSLGEDPANEAQVAKQTALQLGMVHHSLHLNGEEVVAHARGYFEALDQPTIDGLNTYLISAAVRAKGIKVALSGLGGDELFGGYPSLSNIIHWLPWTRRFSRLPRVLRSTLAPQALRILPMPQRYKAIDMMLCEPTILSIGLHRRRLFSDTELGRLGLPSHAVGLSRDFQLAGDHLQPKWFENDSAAAISVVESMGYMRNMLLRDTDVFGMAHGLEIRVPLLDRDLIDFVYALPGVLRVPRNGLNKPLLASALEDRLPKNLTVLPKRGFNVRQERWLRGHLKDFAEQALDVSSSILDPSCIQRLWRDFLRGNDRLWPRIWACVSLGSCIPRLTETGFSPRS